MSPTGRTIMIGLNDGTHEIIDLLLVTSLKSRPERAPRSRRPRAN